MKNKYEIAVVGTGPAAISAALNCKSRNKDIVLIGPREGSRKISLAKLVDNYLGFEDLSGKELNDRFMASILNRNIDYIDNTVTTIYTLPHGFFLELKDGAMIESQAVVVATGVSPSSKIKGEDRFLGNGISYCATCDANLYKDKKLVVVGYNQESIEEAKFLNSIASSVIFVNLTGGKVEFNDTIEVVEDKVIEFVGQEVLEGLKLKSKDLQADGYFVIRDALGVADMIPGIELNKNHIKVDRDFATNLPGLFACGDITGLPYQIMKAAGEGNVAGISASKYIESK